MTLAYVTTPLLGVVDTAVVGQFADAALLGGLAAGGVIFSLVFASFNFLRAASTGLVAQAVGRNDVEEEALVMMRFVMLGMVSGFAVLLLSPLIIAASVTFMNPEPAVAEAMRTYLSIRLLCAPAALANYAILGYVLGRGEGLTGLLLQTLLNGVNIVLSIYLGLTLQWGIDGVAWGTFGGELITMIAGLIVVSRRVSIKDLPTWSKVLDAAAIRRTTMINADIMIRSFSLLTAFTLLTRQSAALGTEILAANAVIMNLFLFAGYILDGFATAAEQLAGKAIGARHRPAFRNAVRLTIIWGFGIAVLLSLMFFVFSTPIISLMTASPGTRELASTFLPYAAFTAVTGVLAFQMDGIFIGATWSRDMRNMMLVSLGVFIVALLVLTGPLGNHGLWIALHLFLIARGVLLFLLLPSRMKTAFPEN